MSVSSLFALLSGHSVLYYGTSPIFPSVSRHCPRAGRLLRGAKPIMCEYGSISRIATQNERRLIAFAISGRHLLSRLWSSLLLFLCSGRRAAVTAGCVLCGVSSPSLFPALSLFFFCVSACAGVLCPWSCHRGLQVAAGTAAFAPSRRYRERGGGWLFSLF